MTPTESIGQNIDDRAVGKEVADDDQKLKESLEKLRTVLKETSLLQAKYYYGRKDESDDWQEKYTKSFKAGQQIKRDFFQLAFPIMIAKSEMNTEMSDLATVMMLGAFDDSQYEMAFQLADHLEKLAPSSDSKIIKLRSAYLTNRFKIAQELTPQISDLTKIPAEEVDRFKSLSKLVEKQTAEEKLREAETLADDLPRVELDTSEGKIVLELYENQYPDTVGHFISLVEKDFYKEMVFHKVIKDFLPFSTAHSGLVVFGRHPESGQMGWVRKMVDYRIPSEAPIDGNHRPHFRGTVCIMVANDPTGKPVPDTGGAEFFIELAPLFLLESKYVPFGRVISDMTIVDRLHENFSISKKDFKESPLPDSKSSFLKSAKVIRKRDHVYEPRKIKSKN